ncbi:MAG: hypothetical protein ABI200_07330 [Gaiellales bacterium]
MLHTDIPTSEDIHRLASSRHATSVSIYLPTSLIANENDAARLQLKNLTGEATSQLRDAGTAKADIDKIEEELFDLIDDTMFWTYTSHSLAIFATPESVQVFRIPSRLVAAVEVSDRFLIKPLMRAVTFPHSAFVIALAQNSVRLIEVSADSPAKTVDVSGLPDSIADYITKAPIVDRSPSGRVQGDRQKAQMRQYARSIDNGVRGVLAGRQVPIILAGTEPLLSVYRSVNTSSLLAKDEIPGNPENRTDSELAEQTRPILDAMYAESIKNARELFDARSAEGRTALDLGDIARAATNGAVDTIFVNIDESVPGSIDEMTGAVTIDEADDAINYGVVDEIVRRVLLSRGRVLAVRADEVPGDGAAAAILRYPS